MEKEIRTNIKRIYEMLWNVLALYERTKGYNEAPTGGTDIWEYMGSKLFEVRKAVDVLFLGKTDVRDNLTRIVDETESFVRSYEVPGVVKRWKKINPCIIFFDFAFDLMESDPDLSHEISMGLTNINLNCYPSVPLSKIRTQYFKELDERNIRDNLNYSEDRIFQNELIRTLTLVFENDFKEYIC